MEKVALPGFIQEVIDEILLVADKGDFERGATVGEPMTKHDKPIPFEFNPWEKACVEVGTAAMQEHLMKVLQGAPQESSEVQNLVRKVSMVMDVFFWGSVQSRMENGGPLKMGLRKGWQLVEEKKCDCAVAQMEGKGGGIGIEIIEIGLPGKRGEGLGEALSRIFGRKR